MRTSAQACAYALYYAQHHVPIPSGQCDHYVGVWYGLAHSGYLTAYSHFSHIPQLYRHGHTLAPAGALHFWTNGGAGHVAIGLGNNLIASTDFPSSGYVGVVGVGEIATHWGQSYLGWTDAYFGSQGIVIVATKPPVTVIPTISLNHVIYAAHHDPVAAQGHTTFPADVKPVERALVALGYLASTYGSDGAYGSSTVSAYSAWQRHLGYSGAGADGIPGMTSLTKLGAATSYKFKVAA